MTPFEHGNVHPTALARPVEGLDRIAEAAPIIEVTDERCDEARLHWLRGDLLNATGDKAAAEQSYRQALTVAERTERLRYSVVLSHFLDTMRPTSGAWQARRYRGRYLTWETGVAP